MRNEAWALARSLGSILALTFLWERVLLADCGIFEFSSPVTGSCALASSEGFEVRNVGCSPTFDSGIAISALLQLPSDMSYYGALGAEEVIVSVYSSSAAQSWLELVLDPQKGLWLRLASISGGVLSTSNLRILQMSYEFLIMARNYPLALRLTVRAGGTQLLVKALFGAVTHGFVANELRLSDARLKIFSSFSGAVTGTAPSGTFRLFWAGEILAGSRRAFNCVQVRKSRTEFNPANLWDTESPSDDNQIISQLLTTLNGTSEERLNLHARVQDLSTLTATFAGCTVDPSMLSTLAGEDAAWIQRGLLFRHDDFMECSVGDGLPAADFSLAIRMKLLRAPKTDLYVLSVVLRSQLLPYELGARVDSTSGSEGVALGLVISSDGSLFFETWGQQRALLTQVAIDSSVLLGVEVTRVAGAEGGAEARVAWLWVDGMRSGSPVLLPADVAGLDTRQDFAAAFFIGNRPRSAFVTTANGIPDPTTLLNENLFTSTKVSGSVLRNLRENGEFELAVADVLIAIHSPLTTFLPLLSYCRFGTPSHCLLCIDGYALSADALCEPYVVGVAGAHSEFPGVNLGCAADGFFNTVLGLCQRCPLDCLRCDNVTHCTQKSIGCANGCAACSFPTTSNCVACAAGFARRLGGCQACLRSHCLRCEDSASSCGECDTGFYLNSASLDCAACDPTCADCLGAPRNCTACPAGTALRNGECPTLAAGTYAVAALRLVRACTVGCRVCDAAGAGDCLTCEAPHASAITVNNFIARVSRFRCVDECEAESFFLTDFNGITGIFCAPCEAVVPRCIRCVSTGSGGSVHCFRCRSGFFVSTVPTQSCVACDPGCVDCVGKAGNCIACLAGQTLRFDVDKGYFVCVVLDSQAIVPTELNCRAEQVFWKGECLTECPVTMFRGHRGSACWPCELEFPHCFDCDKLGAFCSRCLPGYELFDGVCVDCGGDPTRCCGPGRGVLVGASCGPCTDQNCEFCPFRQRCSRCQQGWTLTGTGQCIQALTSCIRHSFDGQQCLACNTGVGLSASGGTCVVCDEAFLVFEAVRAGIVCGECDEACVGCVKPWSNAACVACANGFLLSSSGVCEGCLNRSLCSQFSIGSCVCVLCSLGAVKVNGVCYLQCPQGTFAQGAGCSSCFNCLSCVDATPSGCSHPLLCVEDSYPLNGVCCPRGFGFDAVSSTCLTLSASCAEGSGGVCVTPTAQLTPAPGATLSFGGQCEFGEAVSFDLSTGWQFICLSSTDLPTSCPRARRPPSGAVACLPNSVGAVVAVGCSAGWTPVLAGQSLCTPCTHECARCWGTGTTSCFEDNTNQPEDPVPEPETWSCATGCVRCESAEWCQTCDESIGLFLYRNSECQTCEFFAGVAGIPAPLTGSMKADLQTVCSVATSVMEFSPPDPPHWFDVESTDLGEFDLPETVVYGVLIRWDFELRNREPWTSGSLKLSMSEIEAVRFAPSRLQFSSTPADPTETKLAVTELSVEFVPTGGFTERKVSVQVTAEAETGAQFRLGTLRIWALECPSNCLACSGARSCDNCVSGLLYSSESNGCVSPFLSQEALERVPVLRPGFATELIFVFLPEALLPGRELLEYSRVDVTLSGQVFTNFSRRTFRDNVICLELAGGVTAPGGPLRLDFPNPFVGRDTRIGYTLSSIDLPPLRPPAPDSWLSALNDFAKKHGASIQWPLIVSAVLQPSSPVLWQLNSLLVRMVLDELASPRFSSDAKGVFTSPPRKQTETTRTSLARFSLFTVEAGRFSSPAAVILGEDSEWLPKEILLGPDQQETLLFESLERSLPAKTAFWDRGFPKSFLLNSQIPLVILVCVGLFHLCVLALLLLVQRRFPLKVDLQATLQNLKSSLEFSVYLSLLPRLLPGILLFAGLHLSSLQLSAFEIVAICLAGLIVCIGLVFVGLAFAAIRNRGPVDKMSFIFNGTHHPENFVSLLPDDPDTPKKPEIARKKRVGLPPMNPLSNLVGPSLTPQASLSAKGASNEITPIRSVFKGETAAPENDEYGKKLGKFLGEIPLSQAIFHCLWIKNNRTFRRFRAIFWPFSMYYYPVSMLYTYLVIIVFWAMPYEFFSLAIGVCQILYFICLALVFPFDNFFGGAGLLILELTQGILFILEFFDRKIQDSAYQELLLNFDFSSPENWDDPALSEPFSFAKKFGILFLLALLGVYALVYLFVAAQWIFVMAKRLDFKSNKVEAMN